MKKLFIFSILISGLIFTSCKKEEEAQQQPETSAAVAGHKIIAEEVIQTNSYTYINAREGDKTYWIAVGKINVEEGATLYYPRGMEMKNFESKDLDRTFESILFVDQVSDKPMGMPGMAAGADPHAKAKNAEKEQISVKPAEGGISIGELYADKTSYKDRLAVISGKVTKFNPGIMGRNWVHIQDGTEADGNFDLTVTTESEVKVGDIVTFSGTIALDKDFGAGYSYKVIMENATVVN